MFNKRKFATGAGVVALAATMTLVGATAAYAGTDERIDVAGGEVTFTADGDYIDAYDLRKDGYCMTAELMITNQPDYWTVSSCGYNTYHYRSLSFINEGAPVYIRACYTKKHSGGSYTRVKCSGWQGAHA
ncbi:hypothetical protein [Streptomyces sp. NPDC048565]|uniref:Secreted protein n=1 Tax=Streptomyces sp. NBC_01401 TaxID=2903854 RepID=A0AAU3H384_9ACTN